MKNLALVAILSLALLSGPARADLADTFDMKNLSASYAASCEEQAAARHRNILPPENPGGPQAFSNDKESLVIYSPALTAAEKRAAKKLINSLPGYFLPIAWRGGAVYVFTRHGIVEAIPAFSNQRGWFADYGLYMEKERRLYIPFEKGKNLCWKKGRGCYVAGRWIPSDRDQFRVVNHESGHMVDNMLGEFSHDAEGPDGQYRLSNRPDYLAAVKSDLARLASPHRPIPLERIRKLGYYMPQLNINGYRAGIQTEQRARREVFAELWAEAHGFDKNHLSEAYPDTFKLVKSFAAFLKEQDEKAPVKCKIIEE